MSVLDAEAAAVRAEGLEAARAGLAAESSPYAAVGGSPAAEWLIGYLGFRGRVPAVVLDAAKVARRRESRRRASELLRLADPKRRRRTRPAFAGTCKREGCGKPVPWDPKRSSAANRKRPYCCAECARIVQHETAVARREELWRTDPRAARALERRTRNTFGVSRPARDRNEPPPRVASPPPVVRPSPVRPLPVTELMWRAACEYADPVVMRRFMGLDETQVARVLELQRRGARGPREAGSAAA